jgi:hypothetical protein
MYDIPAIVAMSTASTVLRYCAAVFLILVAIGLVYALIRLGRTLGQAEQMIDEVNTEVLPLLKEATQTLDNINEELVKVDVVMSTVVDVTEKVDTTTRAVESAISLPAKKAAAWGAGVSQAMSSLFGRGEAGSAGAEWETDDAAPWRRETSPPPAEPAPQPAAATWQPDAASAEAPAAGDAPAGAASGVAPDAGADAGATDEVPSS